MSRTSEPPGGRGSAVDGSPSFRPVDGLVEPPGPALHRRGMSHHRRLVRLRLRLQRLLVLQLGTWLYDGPPTIAALWALTDLRWRSVPVALAVQATAGVATLLATKHLDGRAPGKTPFLLVGLASTALGTAAALPWSFLPAMAVAAVRLPALAVQAVVQARWARSGFGWADLVDERAAATVEAPRRGAPTGATVGPVSPPPVARDSMPGSTAHR